jgi:hypothetical protein
LRRGREEGKKEGEGGERRGRRRRPDGTNFQCLVFHPRQAFCVLRRKREGGSRS